MTELSKLRLLEIVIDLCKSKASYRNKEGETVYHSLDLDSNIEVYNNLTITLEKSV